ncbi:phytosulfokines 1-like [Miscanthus floridulus]|uniref:phytosulfokines 1-like n=1 Tax=Miscanthus floridulus TaxID=154761 RepID=UPI0034597A72
MAVACLLCMVALLLVQDVQSRKLLWTEQEKKETHGGLVGNHGAAGRSTTLEPCSDATGGGTGSADKGELPCDDTSKWTEMHTDYIYTQDVKHP